MTKSNKHFRQKTKIKSKIADKINTDTEGEGRHGRSMDIETGKVGTVDLCIYRGRR